MGKPEEIKLTGPDITWIVRLVKEFGSIVFVLLFAFFLLYNTIPQQRAEYREMLTQQQTAFKEALAELRTDFREEMKEQQEVFERTIRALTNEKPPIE